MRNYVNDNLFKNTAGVNFMPAGKIHYLPDFSIDEGVVFAFLAPHDLHNEFTILIDWEFSHPDGRRIKVAVCRSYPTDQPVYFFLARHLDDFSFYLPLLIQQPVLAECEGWEETLHVPPFAYSLACELVNNSNLWTPYEPL